MCSSSGQKSFVRGPVVLKEKPHFQRALLIGVTLGVITYFATPLAFYALTSVLGSPHPEHIPGGGLKPHHNRSRICLENVDIT